jgi:hypothetical protein
MAKLTNVRERVHQPFRDTLCRYGGWTGGNVGDRTDLFTQAGKNDAETNLKNGSTLPSDQSMVVLAVRVFAWFRQAIQRSGPAIDVGNVWNPADRNGDFSIAALFFGPAGTLLNGSTIGDVRDVYRLHWQSSEQLLWSFGAGDKFSITSMPTAYFPYGGGLHGDMGGVTDLIHWNNGLPDHTGILRLARAILLPPRQNIKAQANIVSLPDGGNQAVFGLVQGARNMMSLTNNLNAVDGIGKVISLTFDGLFSRDVQ